MILHCFLYSCHNIVYKKNKFIRKENLTPQEEKSDLPREVNLEELDIPDPFSLWEPIRQSSFFTTGGLAAVHVENRSREGIWESFKRRETYATSGPRILLWFNLIDQTKTLPMGSEITKSETPVFEVKALGSFKQKPGCPDYKLGNLSSEKIKTLCKNECYNPSDKRKLITRIEVVKVLKQRSEQSKVSVRNIRRDGQDEIRKLEKEGNCSEDDSRRASSDLQKLTDDSIKIIDSESSSKESEIMQV